MAERPDEEDIKKWHRWFAIEANNAAWTMSESESLNEDQKEELLIIASASAYHWNSIGTELNQARSNMLLARVHTILDHGRIANRYASKAYEYFENSNSEPWEMAFAHAMLAHASYLDGDLSLYEKHYGLADNLGNQLDKEDREIFLATFKLIPTLKGSNAT